MGMPAPYSQEFREQAVDLVRRDERSIPEIRASPAANHECGARVVGQLIRMDVSTFADQLFFVTAYLEGSGAGDTWSGTGFCFALESDQGTVHVLVSNKHVLARAESLRVRMVASAGDRPRLGSATQMDVAGAASLVVGHPDPAVDVAVMPLSPVLEEMAKNGAPPFFRSVSPEICLTPEGARGLDSIEDVLFVGYPNAIFDTKNFTPIARRGTTATPIQLDYRGEPAFLVDASIFPGSSGSPVFLSDTGTYRSRDGAVVVGSRLVALGVLAAVHTAQVGGTAAALPARQTVQVETPMGLGIVYKAETIVACIDLLLARHGASRAVTGND